MQDCYRTLKGSARIISKEVRINSEVEYVVTNQTGKFRPEHFPAATKELLCQEKSTYK